MLALTLFSGTTAMAQSTAGDYSAGTTALSTVAEEIVKYVPVMVKLCYAIAGVVAIIGAISVYIAMNNEEQDNVFPCFSSHGTFMRQCRKTKEEPVLLQSGKDMHQPPS